MLSSRCLKICVPKEQIPELLKAGDQEKFNGYFARCMKECTVSYIQTREYLRDRFLREMDETIKKNDEIYKDFYHKKE